MDLIYNKELPVDSCAKHLTPALSELLKGLKEADFSFLAYRSSDHNAVMVVLDLSGESESISEIVRKEMKITLVLIDTGMGSLPKVPPESEIVSCSDEANRNSENEKIFWKVHHFKNSLYTRDSFDYSGLGRKIYVYKNCRYGLSHLHSLMTVYNVRQLIAALKFFEEESKKRLDEKKGIHDLNLASIKQKALNYDRNCHKGGDMKWN